MFRVVPTGGTQGREVTEMAKITRIGEEEWEVPAPEPMFIPASEPSRETPAPVEAPIETPEEVPAS